MVPMNLATITLPVWLFAVLVGLSAFVLLERLLLPGMRWTLRRRVEKVLNELDQRLHIRIQPFKLTRRKALLERLEHDALIARAVTTWSAEHDEPENRVRIRVRAYADEIVPAFNAWIYFRLGYALARRVARWMFRVRLGYADSAGLKNVSPDSAVVFVMNHRSNMDYVLVAYLAAEQTALSYAVGEWARVWPLQTLIRALGAYFVRRKSGDPLYRTVLQRYIAMSTEEGVTQAIFLEGNLSADGSLGKPQLGLLDYLVRDFDPDGKRDIVFIPVGINYDRTLEDRSLLLRRNPELSRKYSGGVVGNTVRFLMSHLRLMAGRRWHRFGYACVNFGTPVSLTSYLARKRLRPKSMEREHRFSEVRNLAGELMAGIARVIPVLPVPLVATILLRAGEDGLNELGIKSEAWKLLGVLNSRGAHVYIPRNDEDYALTVGLQMLTLRRLVVQQDGIFRIVRKELPVLRYYAESIRHFLAPGGEGNA